ncbi:MAG: hypothetical protein WC891_08630 [Actinomycetota bacterium]
MGPKKRITSIDGHTPMTLMLDTLDGGVGSDRWQLAAWFLRLCKFEELESSEDFDKAYAGWLSTHQLLAPIVKAYDDTLTGMLRGLQAYDTSKARRRVQWFENEIQGAFEEVAAILEENQELKIKEVWPRLKVILEPIVKGKRK